MNSATGENQGYSTVQSAHVNRANKYTCNGEKDRNGERERECVCLTVCATYSTRTYICRGIYLWHVFNELATCVAYYLHNLMYLNVILFADSLTHTHTNTHSHTHRYTLEHMRGS